MARINEFTDMATIVEVMEIFNVLRGRSICISGHLGRPRKEIVDIIERAGGIFHSSIKYTTDFLLTNADWTNTANGVASKYQKATKKGVKIINEKDFYDLICESS